LSSRRTQRTVVERIRRTWALAVLSAAVAGSVFFFMRAILDYTALWFRRIFEWRYATLHSEGVRKAIREKSRTSV
jgi:hypothetical protein